MNELDYRVAIEALENHVAQTRPIYETSKAIDYLKKAHKEALAQPEQEPVAWMDIDEKGAASGLRYWHEPENRHEVALYTTPPQRTWVGLTDDEIEMIVENRRAAHWEFVRQVEAKLKEKNT